MSGASKPQVGWVAVEGRETVREYEGGASWSLPLSFVAILLVSCALWVGIVWLAIRLWP